MSLQLRPRNVVRAFNWLTFAAAAIAVALVVPRDATLATLNARLLVSFATVLVAIAVRYSIPLRGFKSRRGGEDSVSLDLPITLSLFLVEGGAAAAIATLIGFPLARLFRKRADIAPLAFGGASRAIFFLLAELVRRQLPLEKLDYSVGAFFGFFTLMMLGMLAFIYFWHLPAAAWRERRSLDQLWRRYLRDRHLWGLLAMQAVWAYACYQFMTHGNALLGLLAWLPMPTIAIMGRSLYLARSEAHRLRLTRDAITAMLIQRDPIPQINSVVASALGGSARETVQVVAAIERDGEWKVVTSIGPPRDAEFDTLRAQAVRRLFDRRGGWLAAEDGARSVIAAGAYDEKGMLVGALCALRYARDGRIGHRGDRRSHPTCEPLDDPRLRPCHTRGRAGRAGRPAANRCRPL